jgi:Protein of unknown function (DUF2807).
MLFSSCIINGEGITPSKNYITRNYKVTDFSGIEVNTVGSVYYTQSADGKTSVEIYGPDNIVELIEVSIKDNTLVLSTAKKNKIKNVKNMKIKITTPQLYNLSFKGVGKVYIEEGLETTNFKIHQGGVGDVVIHSLVCDEVTINSTGVGNSRLDGNVNTAYLSVQGVGNIEAKDLKAQAVEVSSSGVGNITCFATESFTAAVGGIGSIKYAGSPKQKQIKKNGIGSIKEY